MDVPYEFIWLADQEYISESWLQQRLILSASLDAPSVDGIWEAEDDPGIARI